VRERGGNIKQKISELNLGIKDNILSKFNLYIAYRNMKYKKLFPWDFVGEISEVIML